MHAYKQKSRGLDRDVPIMYPSNLGYDPVASGHPGLTDKVASPG